MMSIFNSMDSNYRNPVGAVEEGTKIHFRVFLARKLKCSSVTLVVIDDDFETTSFFSTFWCGIVENDCECWECHFTPEHDGLFWYKFEVQTCEGKKDVAKSSLFKGTFELKESCNSQPMFQITVYKKGFSVPSWLEGGTMYQIFPDRFCFSGEKKEGVPTDRILRDDWGGLPNFKPNQNGVVENSDYFCGDFKGIESKLEYLQSLGVTCIYLNPIFEAQSNHRYNTSNYETTDPLLGSEEEFKSLCKSANEKNIKIIIDGVFNHTGDDSLYFNKKNRYKSVGAYNSVESEYFSWYKFSNWPDEYKSWWGFSTLPELDKYNISYKNYINGQNGIVKKWIKNGASGWRLDVADELPDCFIKDIRAAAKKENKETIILGEVWEDATTKKGFGRRRRYFLGEELDSVMNYPFREATVGFLTGSRAEDVMEQLLTIIENYPAVVINSLMNVLGTHDTQRIITRIAGNPIGTNDKSWQAEERLSEEQRLRGIKLMKVASAMQYTLPGVPCIYYGDEVGLEGYKDPFCRRCYPWGNENQELLSWYKFLGKLRKNHSSLKNGKFIPLEANKNFLMYMRKNDQDCLLCAFNMSKEAVEVDVEDARLEIFPEDCKIINF